MHASQICIYEIYNKIIKERIGCAKEEKVVRTDIGRHTCELRTFSTDTVSKKCKSKARRSQKEK